MKRKDLYVYMESIEKVSSLKGVKFAYTLIKNKKKIEEEIKILEEVVKPSEGFTEYEKQRINLCEINCEKNKEGNPIIENNRYKIINVEKFDSELNELKEKNKEFIKEREKQINEYNNMLNDDIEIDFSKVGFEDLPTDISTEQLESIEFMVNF